MSLRDVRRQVGELLIGSCRGTSVSPELRSLAREFGLGGITLFSRNVEAPEQVAELACEVTSLGGQWPAWVAIDQEGGRVARLRAPFTEWPPMATLGRANDVALATRFARALAQELRIVGISLDFAPVLDVHTNAANPVIGDRALSDQAERVATLGAAIIVGLQAEGVVACGKHFPGHGDTSVDSHVDLPVVEHPPERLQEVELVPFRRAIEAGVGALMTAHVLVPALDETEPATLSPVIVDGLLREALGYQGLVVSDDLEMRAIADRMSVVEAAVAAVAAGCDGVLVCGGDLDRQAAVLEGLIKAVEAARLAQSRVEKALVRHHRLKERALSRRGPAPSPLAPGWRPPGPEALRQIIGASEHQAVAEEMAQYV